MKETVHVNIEHKLISGSCVFCKAMQLELKEIDKEVIIVCNGCGREFTVDVLPDHQDEEMTKFIENFFGHKKPLPRLFEAYLVERER